MLIVDTGPLVATADRDDPDNDVCQQLLEIEVGPLITTPMVIAEAAYLIARRGGPTAEATLYQSIIDGGPGRRTTQRARIAELVEAYADLNLGGTDAGIIAIAERLDITRIATLDRRHFTVVRPAHTDSFELLPDG